MDIRRWIGTIRSTFVRGQKSTLNRNRFRPMVEGLEDRVVPSNWLVTNTSNNAATSGSLPWAVSHADSDTSNANITFSSPAFPNATTITLASTLTLSNTAHSITIDGSGAGPITISGGGAVRDFLVNSSVTATFINLTISGGAIANIGGGISNAGTATLSNCIVSTRPVLNSEYGLGKTTVCQMRNVRFPAA